jgi:glycosyltransferase involved in cell wall biosynthesis
VGSLLADRVIIHGPNTKKQAIEAGYQVEKLRIIPHGVFSHFPTETNVSDIQNAKENVLLFGNLRKNKGVDRVPKIASIVNEAGLDVEFTVAGSIGSADDDSTWINSTIKQLESNPNVDLNIGYLSSKQVSNHFQRASVVLLPYYDATMSGVLMTAYAFNTPVVVTDTGDIGFYVNQDQTGLVADSNSTEDIANRLIDILKSPKLYSQLVHNISIAKDQYSWSNVATKTVEVYKEIQ